MSVRDPEETGAAATPAHGEISPLTTLGAVHLTVSDLERSLELLPQRRRAERARVGRGPGRARGRRP